MFSEVRRLTHAVSPTIFEAVPEREREPGKPVKGGDDWESHWTSYAESAAQNPAQTYRRKLVFELLELEAALGPVRLIELGCGQGDFARDVAAAHPSVEIAGVDLSATGVAIASRKVPRGRFSQC